MTLLQGVRKSNIISLATQPNVGRFVFTSADAFSIESYWAARPVSEDLRPAGCVAASATDTGRFAMKSEMYGITKEELHKDYVIKRMTQEEIAKKYNLTAWKIHNAVKKMGIKGRKKGPRPILPGTEVVCTHCGEVYPWSPEYFMTCNEAAYGCKQPCNKCNVERAHEWQKNHRERRNRWARERYDTKKDRERKRRYREENRAKVNARAQRKRARRRQAEGSYTAKEFKTLCERYGNQCLRCGRVDVKLTADHVVPLSRGGTNYISNIQPLCMPCNSKKGTKKTDYRTQSRIKRWIQRKLF